MISKESGKISRALSCKKTHLTRFSSRVIVWENHLEVIQTILK